VSQKRQPSPFLPSSAPSLGHKSAHSHLPSSSVWSPPVHQTVSHDSPRVLLCPLPCPDRNSGQGQPSAPQEPIRTFQGLGYLHLCPWCCPVTGNSNSLRTKGQTVGEEWRRAHYREKMLIESPGPFSPCPCLPPFLVR
jgi:hypothetical protein